MHKKKKNKKKKHQQHGELGKRGTLHTRVIPQALLPEVEIVTQEKHDIDYNSQRAAHILNSPEKIPPCHVRASTDKSAQGALLQHFRITPSTALTHVQ